MRLRGQVIGQVPFEMCGRERAWGELRGGGEKAPRETTGDVVGKKTLYTRVTCLVPFYSTMPTVGVGGGVGKKKRA